MFHQSLGGSISDEEVVIKVLYPLFFSSIYSIRVTTIHEFRAMPGNILTFGALIGRWTAFELINFNNSVAKIKNYSKTSLTVGIFKKYKCRKEEG